MSEMLIGGNQTSNLIKDSNTATFIADVIAESNDQPVLVDFWAPWCEPCKQLTPILEKVVNEAKGRVKLVKVNIDENQEIAGQMRIQSIPAVIAFKDERPVDGFMGAVPESQINEFIDKIAGPALPSQADVHLEQGEELLKSEDFEVAAGHFSAVMQMEPANVNAIAGLARCAIGLGEMEQARQILDTVPEESRDDAAVKAVEAQIDLLSRAADTGEIDALQTRIDGDENDHQARFDLAIALNAAGNRDDAATSLLEIIRRDRTWNDEGARKELLTFFEAWGPMDKATLAARRQLSSLLFS